MTTCSVPTLPVYADALRVLGFVPGAPSPAIAAIDAECAAEAECERCGALGLNYLPWARRGRYVAVTTCPACGAVGEM